MSKAFKRIKEKTEIEFLKSKTYTEINEMFNQMKSEIDELKEAGKEATALIAHLKDQYGFSDEEQEAQDRIMDVFEYEGRW